MNIICLSILSFQIIVCLSLSDQDSHGVQKKNDFDWFRVPPSPPVEAQRDGRKRGDKDTQGLNPHVPAHRDGPVLPSEEVEGPPKGVGGRAAAGIVPEVKLIDKKKGPVGGGPIPMDTS